VKWRKIGRVFVADGHYDWMVSHASNPVPEHVEGDIFRIYFSCRDANNRSSIGFVLIDLNNPLEPLEISNKPLLSPGEVGLFDDSGVTVSCIVQVGEERYLYYLGWHLCVTVPWLNAIGLAVSSGREPSYEKVGRAPIVDRSEVDPFSISYPWVMNEGTSWTMWYGSCLRWGRRPMAMEYEYVIKHATSDDGRHWRRDGTTCVRGDRPEIYAIARPCVVRDTEGYHMWYAYGGRQYRIGYAISEDGVKWTQEHSRVGIDVSATGWDSEAVAYPCVFEHKGQQYMLYNGDGYGKTGFGLAERVQE